MTREEYENRKRRLEEQHRAGIQLLEAAYRQQLRALDLVWMTTAEEEEALPPPAAEAPSQPQVQPAAAPPPAPPAPPPQSARRSAWQLQGEVEKALAEVPDVFDRNDLCQALGYEPDRGSLYRALQQLVSDGAVAIQAAGSGKAPSRYRKTGAGSSPTGG